MYSANQLYFVGVVQNKERTNIFTAVIVLVNTVLRC